ncbi:hypothetical protein CGMCC3_g16563 [Colletotrichum fructicola]|uniref:NmrA-like family protein n=1 Tax=Colletotrichum fructicola (strain Nara gc5) TaxID=1213859 RepID=L2G1B8_COLFN|nr:uncharacterized protein CGMCC3_g16563 [Colletotrichum fructicola]KAE9567258.1 hypothetical protein CGMCC3_g16563 [Colletotrichum fructicola]KAF4890749.1 Oxidoreductase BOA1 [Colletotrichum fructicola]KAF4928381.1 Oxidoreductase BOA1 [Colletotrichum fructicola]KAF5509204.1 Oxidoreductase BOA1 [Colletotrichum fructicola]
MVRVAIAGGTGNVSAEIVHILGQSGKHEVEVLTRSDTPRHAVEGVKFVQVDYGDRDDLRSKLTGVHTVLCFIGGIEMQKRIIDICVEAGVKRFAPNEWATRSYSGSFSFQDKDIVYEYLKEINREKKILEFCLFQPGLFMNYLSFPHPSTVRHALYNSMFDVENRRALVPEKGDYRLTMTTIQDLGRVVDAALAYESAWPEVGGISGSSIACSEIIRVAESIRGKFEIITIPQSTLEAGKLGVAWDAQLEQPSHLKIDQDWESFTHSFIAEIIRGACDGAWLVSDDWNQLLPHLELTTVEEFLTDIWKD